ncbi:MAG: hypothetical protein AB8G05_11020 [Oligoflexales bacterium]
MLRLVRILAGLALLNILACKSKNPESSQLKAVVQNSERLYFSAKENRFFYDMIFDLGNRNGLEISKNNSQEIRGMIHCNQDSTYKNCFFLPKKIPKYSDGMSLESIKIGIEKKLFTRRNQVRRCT